MANATLPPARDCILCSSVLPVAVLLLPDSFREIDESLPRRRDLIRVDPARISYRALRRLPIGVVEALATGQARRLKLPGTPRVVVMFAPVQLPLARGVLAYGEDAELWYVRPPGAAGTLDQEA